MKFLPILLAVICLLVSGCSPDRSDATAPVINQQPTKTGDPIKDNPYIPADQKQKLMDERAKNGTATPPPPGK